MASILANTTIATVARGGGLLIGLAITALLGRVLGVEQFGSYTVILSFGALLHVVTDGGLYLTLTRELTRGEGQQQLLAATTTLRLSLFLAVFAGGAAIIYFLPQYTHLFLLYVIAAAGFLFQSLSQLLMGVFQAYQTIWPATVGDITGRVVQLVVVGILAAGLVIAGGSLTVAMVAFTLGAAVAYGVHSWFVPRLRAWRITYAPALWRNIIRQSWPLGVMLLLNAIYFRIDMLMLSYLRSATEVGWYGLAYRVVESSLFLPAAFGGLLLPKLSAVAHRNDRAMLLQQAIFTMALAGALVFVVLAGSATPLITFLVGEEFASSGPLLAILSAALVTMFFGNVYGFALVALNKQRQLMYLYAALAVGNAVGNALLIPQFGASAAAWTTVATEAASTIVAAFLVSQSVPHSIPVRGVMTIIACAALSALTLWLLLPITHVVVAIITCSLVYVGCAALSGLLGRRHFTLLTAP